jgi:hypothetical protein
VRRRASQIHAADTAIAAALDEESEGDPVAIEEINIGEMVKNSRLLEILLCVIAAVALAQQSTTATANKTRRTKG